MHQLSEIETEFKNSNFGRLLLKFYNWYFSVIFTRFLISAHIELLISAKSEIFFLTDKLFKSISNIIKSLISIVNV